MDVELTVECSFSNDAVTVAGIEAAPPPLWIHEYVIDYLVIWFERDLQASANGNRIKPFFYKRVLKLGSDLNNANWCVVIDVKRWDCGNLICKCQNLFRMIFWILTLTWVLSEPLVPGTPTGPAPRKLKACHFFSKMYDGGGNYRPGFLAFTSIGLASLAPDHW